MYWLFYIQVFIFVIILFGFLFLLMHRYIKNDSIKNLLQNIALSLFVIMLTFMALEFLFKVFFAQSDGFRYTLASQNWYERYWDQNSLGYRDMEWTPEMLADKTKVMVVGDSFVAGTGIRNPEDRFSKQLGELLGNDYAVLIVASPGWDTIDEVKAIVEYPYKPDILILSYYINDIEGVAYESGAQRPQIRQDPPGWLTPLVNNSHVANFLYWRLIRLGPQEWADIYWNDWLKKISNDPEIWWRHQQELLTIIEGTASEEIPLFVVVFPNLTAVEESRFITDPVIDLFQKNDVPVLDVSAILVGRDPADTTVNAVDAHPNEMVNKEVAEQLYQMIQTELK